MPVVDAKEAKYDERPPKPEAADQSKSNAETGQALEDTHDVVEVTNEDTVIF